MPYREAPRPEEEILQTFEVRVAKGADAIGVLVAVSCIFAVAWVVSLVSGAPPAIEPWVWTFPIAAVVIALPAVWLWRRRRRNLHLVRVHDRVRLVVRGEVEVTFPLTASGSQVAMPIKGVPVHHVYMKLVDADGRAIFFQEIRGAAHGPLPGWFTEIDRTPAAAYEVGHVGQIAVLRARVEEINGKDPADVT